MKLFLSILALVIAAIVIPLFFLPSADERAAKPPEGLPWQIEVLPDGGSKVFGLTIGSSTLSDARARLGNDMEVGVVAAPGERGALEAYYASAAMGFVTGKLILTADLSDDVVAAMRERAVKTEYMESATRRSTLHPDDRALADRTPIRAISFIPSVDLDEAMVLQRFGVPGERIRSSEQAEHLLYPEKGLDVILDSKGKEVLQYVAPRHFARLRAPLIADKQGADQGRRP